MKNKLDNKSFGLLLESEAKDIIKKLIEDRCSVSFLEILKLNKWFFETNNYSEDAMVVIETWLQENDYVMVDEFEYYKKHMETPTFYM